MSKIKVLHFVDSLNTGGLEKIVESIARGLDQEKYELEVWCMARGGEIADELIKSGVVVRILGIDSYRNPLNVFKCAAELKKAKAAIVHMHGFFCSVIGTGSSLMAGVPVRIIHIHTSFYTLIWRDVIMNKIVNFFSDKIIYICEASYQSFRDRGYASSKKSIVIYNGINDLTGNKQTVKSAGKVITIVASLYEHKGHTYLLKAVKQLTKDFSDINLWIIGKGPLQDSLTKEAAELGIQDNVTFWGERRDVVEMLGQSLLFVLPSLREGMPVSILEAMACGKPIVASKIGGVPEVVIDSETGFLVEPRDVKALAEKIALLLSDQHKREQMGKRASAVFKEKFSTKEMISKLEGVYETLTQDRLCRK